MGLDSSLFTEYIHASDSNKRKAGAVEYWCTIEPQATISFSTDSGYTGELLRIQSVTDSVATEDIVISQDGTTYTLAGSTSIQTSTGSIITEMDVLFSDGIGHLYVNKDYIGQCTIGSDQNEKLIITGPLHYLKIWNKRAPQNKVLDGYKEFLPEQFYWDFNGNDIGRTRCDVTRFTPSYSIEQKTEDLQSGSSVANTFNSKLQNQLTGFEGAFSDDQYSDRFDPELGFYNGTIEDRYLQQRFKSWFEITYRNKFETQLIGRVTQDIFKRQTSTDSASIVTYKVEDVVEQIATQLTTDGKTWEDKKLTDPDDADNSLLHIWVNAATELNIDNLLTNGDFETSESWTLSSYAINTGTEGFSGNGYAEGTGYIEQQITGDIGSYYVSFYARGTGTITATFGSTINTFTLGSRYHRYEFNGTASSEDPVLRLSGDALIDNVSVSVSPYSGYVNSESYQPIAIVADKYDIVHPWKFLVRGKSYWDALKDLAVASAGTYLGADRYGRFVFESGFVTRLPIKDIDAIHSVGTQIADAGYNQLRVSGTYIVKDDKLRNTWNTEGSNFKSQDLLIIDGDTWPDEDTFGENYFATDKGIE